MKQFSNIMYKSGMDKPFDDDRRRPFLFQSRPWFLVHESFKRSLYVLGPRISETLMTVVLVDDSDVCDIVMLVTLWRWRISVGGGRIIMFVTFMLCWWFSKCIKSVTNILNRSAISENCHQQIWSPTSVTNIDVNVLVGQKSSFFGIFCFECVYLFGFIINNNIIIYYIFIIFHCQILTIRTGYNRGDIKIWQLRWTQCKFAKAKRWQSDWWRQLGWWQYRW